jgi:hypothetical protein
MTILLALVLITTGLGSAPGSPAADAAAPAVSPEAADTDLARIAAAVSEIATLLQRHLEQQDLALMMSRVELATLLLVESDRQLEAARQERDMLSDSIQGSEARFQEFQEMMRKGAPSPAALSPAEREQQEAQERMLVQEYEREAAREKEQLERVKLRLIDLENQAASRRDEITRWQEIVDRYFARRQR